MIVSPVFDKWLILLHMFFISADKLWIDPIPELRMGYFEHPNSPRLENDGTTKYYRKIHYRAAADQSGLPQNVSPAKLENITNINREISAINELIARYNEESQKLDFLMYRKCKIRSLRALERALLEMDDKYNDADLLYFVSYHTAIYDKLYFDIKLQKDYLLITHEYQKQLALETNDPPTLVDFILGLSLHHVTELLDLLGEGVSLQPVDLNAKALFHSCPGVIWAQPIEYLSGGNSQCFTIVEHHTQEKKLLKVETSLNNLKYVERNLREKLARIPEMQDFIPKVYCERRAKHFHSHHREHILARLILSSYCNQGSLKDYIMNHPKGAATYVDDVLDLMLALGERIEGFRECGFANSDLKLSNVLVHIDPVSNKRSLHISDCKAFYECDANGVFLKHSNRRPISTQYSSAPETLKPQKMWDADAIHTYTLGRNIYECLVAADPAMRAVYYMGDRNVYEFYLYQFEMKTFIGNRKFNLLSNLIREMVKKDPEKRISFKCAMEKMKEIRYGFVLHRQQRSLANLNRLKSYQFAHNAQFKEYIKTSQDCVNNTNNVSDLVNLDLDIQYKLQPLLKNKKTNEAMQSLRLCEYRYNELLASGDQLEDPIFYAELERDFTALYSGEDANYYATLIVLSEVIMNRRTEITRGLWLIMSECRAMLGELLQYQFGEHDRETLNYIYEKDRQLIPACMWVPDVTRAAEIKQLHQEIKQMLESLKNRELQQIRRAIHKQRAPKGCGVTFFFRHKYSAETADAMETMLGQLPLSERPNVRQHLATQPASVQRAFNTVSWPHSGCRIRIVPTL